jgi:hypothetical protein
VDCIRYWLIDHHAVDSCFKTTPQKYPDTEAVLHQVYDLLGSIANLTKSSPDWVVNSDSWKNIVSSAKEARVNLCRALEDKSRYSTLYGTYTATLQDLQALLLLATGPQQLSQNPTGQQRWMERYMEIAHTNHRSQGIQKSY